MVKYTFCTIRQKEIPDNDKSGRISQVSLWQCEVFANILANRIDIVSKLSGTWNNRGELSLCSLDEVGYLIVVFLRSTFVLKNNINFVLNNQNLFQFHDINGGQMFSSLGLWTRHISCNQQKGRIHNCGSSQHSGHKNVVTRAIYERNMTLQFEGFSAFRIIAVGVVLHVAFFCLNVKFLYLNSFCNTLELGRRDTCIFLYSRSPNES